MSYVHQLLTDCLVAQGVDKVTAERAVQVVLGVAVASDMIPASKLEIWERDARIYHLRGQRVPCVDLAARFTMSAKQIFIIIRRHQARRRAALKMVS